MKKRTSTSIIIGILLLVLPFLFKATPRADTIISYLLASILIPVIIYFTENFIQKIKENNKIIHWGLLIAFIGAGLFLLKQYLFDLFFRMAFKTGINLIYYVLPNFLFPSFGNLFIKFDFIGFMPFLIIIDFFLVFITYFILGTILGWIIQKVKK